MTTVVLRHADVLVTMDPARREIRDGGMIIRDGVIEAVAPTHELPTVMAANVIDMGGHIVLPGLVNTHHHLYQTLTRVVPAAQDATLFNWLKTLYPIWARLTPEAVYVSALTGLAELLLSGCTTASDHLYLFPNGAQLDDEIRAAKEIGMRFHASRGAMSLGESKGGLPPDSVVENEDEILKDTQRLIQTYHDSRRGAMLRIVVAPCSPFSVTPELMQQSSALARAYGVTLHTHVAETRDEERFCLEKFGHRPVHYMETLRWVGPDVWYAHAVHVNEAEMTLMSRTGCGAAHCPSSNMRLASGIAPVQQYRAAAPPTLALTRRTPYRQGRGHGCLPVKRWRWPPLAARRCWAATTSARWPQACAPTFLPSTSAASTTPAPLCTTRLLRSSSAPRKRQIT